jgi:hypothetical protein
MIIKRIDLKSTSNDAVHTEILFEVAAARADGCELVRFDIKPNEDSNYPIERLYDGVLRVVKSLKQKNLIQFYATGESFVNATTEASFLINKYPDLIETTGEYFVYFKL